MSTITDQIGRDLAGRYRLEAGLGTGASAHVYSATDLRLRRRVAVKLLHPGLSGDAAFFRRFNAEAQAVAALHHPNIVQVLDWGEEDDGPFIVLEQLGGGSLRDLLDSGALLSIPQTVAVGAAAARGLAYAHRRGLIHRDVKPANILFDEDGGVRIADFGLARALAEAAWTEPAGAILGTARYASPEQAEGRSLDERSDVYSLALVCYEAVTGRLPFSRETTFSTLMARVGAVLPPAPELGPLAPILAQAAISEPLARLDADELAANLELLARSLPAPEPLPLAPRSLLLPPAPDDVPEMAPLRERSALASRTARDEDVEERAGSATGDERDVEDDELWPARTHRRGRWLLVLLAVLVVLVGAGIAVKLVVLTKHVPSLKGASLAVARRETSQAGLRLAVAGTRYSLSEPAGSVLSEQPAPGASASKGSTVKVLVSKGPHPVQLPKLAGTSQAGAVAQVRKDHLVAKVVATYSATATAGSVIATQPASGSVPYGSTLTLDVSKGPRPVTIPSLGSDATYGSASADLTRLGLKTVEVLAYSDTVASGTVIATSPAAGTNNVVVGTTVTVTVSKGPQLVAVPSVAGDSVADAVSALRNAGLQVTEQVGPPFATTATTTDPAPGAEVRPGSDVTLYVA